MALAEHIQKIIYKIEAVEELTWEEELVYFTEVMSYSKEEAKKFLYIVDKRKPGVIID